MSSKQLALALQGGGSHGAYTWGVLDRLLEDDRIEIEGISGASAGAMNAVVLAHGYTTGGRDGAREALNRFWGSVSDKLGHSGLAPASRYNTDAGFIGALREEGRASADAWLKRNFRALGARSTFALGGVEA